MALSRATGARRPRGAWRVQGSARLVRDRRLSASFLPAPARYIPRMPQWQPLSEVSHVIQLAVAPVFLLTSVGTILNVLSSRLGRIIDRARVLGDRLPAMDAAGQRQARAELHLLSQRRQLVNLAITSGTVA